MSDLFSSTSTRRAAKHMTQAQTVTVGNWLMENRDKVRTWSLGATTKAINETLGDSFSAEQISRLAGSLGIEYRRPERSDRSSITERVRELRHLVTRMEGTIRSMEARIQDLQAALHVRGGAQ